MSINLNFHNIVKICIDYWFMQNNKNKKKENRKTEKKYLL